MLSSSVVPVCTRVAHVRNNVIPPNARAAIDPSLEIEKGRMLQ